MEGASAGGAGGWVRRAGDGVLDETFELPQHRPIKGSARFEIAPVERVKEGEPLKQFDAMWWVTRWIEAGNRAAAARRGEAAMEGRGGGGESESVTGKARPPADARSRGVNKFADISRIYGGGE